MPGKIKVLESVLDSTLSGSGCLSNLKIIPVLKVFGLLLNKSFNAIQNFEKSSQLSFQFFASAERVNFKVFETETRSSSLSFL